MSVIITVRIKHPVWIEYPKLDIGDGVMVTVVMVTMVGTVSGNG